MYRDGRKLAVEPHTCSYLPTHTLQGLEPLRYQWYKDDRKLAVATSDSPTLIMPEVAALDAGQYYCQVDAHGAVLMPSG